MADGAARSAGRGAEEARTQLPAPRRRPIGERGTLRPGALRRGHCGRARGATPLPGRTAGDATVKFYEASGLFRSAEVAAQNESTARDVRARAASSAPPAPEKTEKPVAAEAPPPPTTSPRSPAAACPARAGAEPAGSGARSASVGTRRDSTGAAAAKSAARSSASGAESGNRCRGAACSLQVRARSARSRRAEACVAWPQRQRRKSPSATSSDTRARSGSRSWIRGPSVSGATGTVSFLRRYELVTVEGQRLRTETRTTMEIRRSGPTWVIERIRFEPAR